MIGFQHLSAAGLTPKALLGGFMDAAGGALNKQVRVLHVQIEESSYFQRYEKVDGAILLRHQGLP